MWGVVCVWGGEGGGGRRRAMSKRYGLRSGAGALPLGGALRSACAGGGAPSVVQAGLAADQVRLQPSRRGLAEMDWQRGHAVRAAQLPAWQAGSLWGSTPSQPLL